MDAVGDLYVLGSPLLARFEGYLAGHALNNDLVLALLANPQAWRYRPAAQALDKVKFNLAWLPQGSTGGAWVARRPRACTQGANSSDKACCRFSVVVLMRTV